MKNLVLLISLVSVAVFQTRCAGTENTQTTAGTLRPLEQATAIDNIEPYVESIQIIQTEESPASLLGQVNKILLDRNGNMLILGVNGVPLMFRPDGSFARQIARQGRGPREYIRIEDVALSNDGSEFMLLDQGLIKCYGLDDTTRYRQITTPASVPYDAIAPASNGGVYLFGAFAADPSKARSPEPMMVRIDSLGNIKGKYIQREDMAFSMNNITQVSNNNYILRPQNSRNEVFRLTPDSLEVACRIDFGDKNIPANYYFDQAKEDIMSYMSAPYYKLPIYFQQTDALWYFKVGDDKTEHSFVISTDGKRGIRWADTSADRPVLQVMASDKDCLYVVVPAEAVLNFKDSPTDQHGALHKFIMEQIASKKLMNNHLNNNPMIAKIKFRI